MKKLKLTELSNEKMVNVKGGGHNQSGDPCVCGCAHAQTGGASDNANGRANYNSNLGTPTGGSVYDKDGFVAGYD